MAHLPSPASASSSTLIVTPLPSKDSIQFDAVPIPTRPGANAHPQLAISISTNPSKPPQAKLSSRGFVEPHHSHLPRRSKTKPNVQAKASHQERERAKTVSFATTAQQPVQSPQAETQTQEAKTQVDNVVDPQTPPSKSFPARLYLPLHEQTPPTHLLSLKLPLTPVVGSTPAFAGLGFPNPAHPSPTQTPKGSLQPTSANLPRRTSKRQTRGQGLTSATAPAGKRDGSGSASSVVSGAGSDISRTHSPTPTPAAARISRSRSRPRPAVAGAGIAPNAAAEGEATTSTSARLMVGQRERGRGVSLHRLTSRVAESPLRSSFKAETSLSLGLQRRMSTEEREALDKTQGCMSEDEAKETQIRKVKEQAQRVCIQEVGCGSGVEVGFLVGGGDDVGVEEQEDFWGLRQDGQAGEQGTRAIADEEVENRRQRLRKVVLQVLELDLDLDLALESGLDAGDSKDPGFAPAAVTSESESRTPAAVNDTDIGTTIDSRSGQPSLPVDSQSKHETQIAQSQVHDPQDLKLELDIPSVLTSYHDGETILTEGQLQEGCAFINRHLGFGSGSGLRASATTDTSSDDARTPLSMQSNPRTRKKIRILSPRARPEEAMSLAICYLTYFRETSKSNPAADSSSSSASSTTAASLVGSSSDAHDPDPNHAWHQSQDLSPAHLLWMDFMDEGDGIGSDNRGRELSTAPDDDNDLDRPYMRRHRRAFVDGHRLGPLHANINDQDQGQEPQEEDVDVVAEDVGHVRKEGDVDAYSGVRAEWRGVLSFDGLVRVHAAGTSGVRHVPEELGS